MDAYLMFGALAFVAYFAWRVSACARRRIQINQEIAWLVYLVLWILLQLVMLIPGWTRTGAIVSLVIWLVAGGVISFRLNRRYRSWLENKLREEQEEQEEL